MNNYAAKIEAMTSQIKGYADLKGMPRGVGMMVAEKERYDNTSQTLEGERQQAQIGVAAERDAETARNEAGYAAEKADLDVWEADQALADGRDSASRSVAALRGTGNRSVGGGSFSRAATGRGRQVLGGAATGGLATANRAAAKAVRSTALGAKYQAKEKANQQASAAKEEAINQSAAAKSAARAKPWEQTGFYTGL